MRDQAGEIAGWLVVMRDMTEEQELARLRDEMTHMLVHDLRSPLSVINGSLEMLDEMARDGDLSSAGRLLALARQGSGRMLEMVESLLSVNRLESGQMPLNPEPVSIAHLLEEATFRLMPLAAQAQITMAVDCDPAVPSVQADRALFGRVLNNLLDNAVKFTPDGGQVRLWARPDPLQAPTSVLIGVNDTGPGIPAEAQQRIFEKFQQVKSTIGRRKGTGLGLALCKLAVEAHGGQIWVESTPDARAAPF